VKELEKDKLTKEIMELENQLADEKLPPEERQKIEKKLANKKEKLDKINKELEEKDSKLESFIDSYNKANPDLLESTTLENGTSKASEETPALPGELEDGTPVKAVEEVPGLPGVLADGTRVGYPDVILNPNEDSPLIDSEVIEQTTPSNSKLRNKLKDLKQKGFLRKVLDYMKEHKMGFIVGAVTLGLAATLGITALMAALKPNDKIENNTQPSISTEQEYTNPDETVEVENQEESKQENAEVAQKPSNEAIFNQMMEEEQERIASGEEPIYRDIYSAAGNENQLYAKSDNIQNIWQQADVEADKYYRVTDEGLIEIQAGDDVINAIAEGNSVVTTWKNEDGTLGRSVISANEMTEAQDNLETESAKTM